MVHRFFSSSLNWIVDRCVPQNCTFGERFNAFYGRCEQIQCRSGFNITSSGKCVGRIMKILCYLKYDYDI
jgi:hypothetical protein